MNNIFRIKLCELMYRTNTTKSDIARGIRVSQSAIQGWVKGSRYPHPNTLRRLADFFEIDLEVFSEDARELPPFEEPQRPTAKEISQNKLSKICEPRPRFFRHGNIIINPDKVEAVHPVDGDTVRLHFLGYQLDLPLKLEEYETFAANFTK